MSSTLEVRVPSFEVIKKAASSIPRGTVAVVLSDDTYLEVEVQGLYPDTDGNVDKHVLVGRLVVDLHNVSMVVSETDSESAVEMLIKE